MPKFRLREKVTIIADTFVEDADPANAMCAILGDLQARNLPRAQSQTREIECREMTDADYATAVEAARSNKVIVESKDPEPVVGDAENKDAVRVEPLPL